jgi:hypothetical protein
MKYKIGDRVYYRGGKYSIRGISEIGGMEVLLIKMNQNIKGVVVQLDYVKPIVRCGNE